MTAFWLVSSTDSDQSTQCGVKRNQNAWKFHKVSFFTLGLD